MQHKLANLNSMYRRHGTRKMNPIPFVDLKVCVTRSDTSNEFLSFGDPTKVGEKSIKFKQLCKCVRSA
jgi:hypothetical protein